MAHHYLSCLLIINSHNCSHTHLFFCVAKSKLAELYNFQPVIFSNYTSSTLKTVFYSPNDNQFYLSGLVSVDLKVITPYDGMLSINVTGLNFTHIDERDYVGLRILDMNYLNFSEHSVSFAVTTIHQYFVLKDAVNSIEDKLLVQLSVFLKPNWLPLDVTAMGFDLGDLTFEANLFAVRTNQTMVKTFTEDVFGMFTPTS